MRKSRIRRKNKNDITKIASLFLISVVALAGIGVGYAHWSEILWLDVEVYTGELCLEWSVDYWEVWEGNYKPEYGYVADVGYELVDEDGDRCYEGLYIWVDNAYPSLWIEGVIDIHNCGTIPAAFYDIEEFYYYAEPEGWPCDSIDFEYEFEGNCEQIDPCDELLFYFYIHFNQNTPENAYAEFYIELEFVNWNEYPSPPPPPPENNPPYEPTNPTPTNGADYEDVYDVYLECTVSDPDGNTMDVSFYWGDGTFIATDSGVPNNGIASIYLPDYIDPDWLSHDTTYTWYAVANDGEFDTQGPTWNFKTCKAWDLNVDRVIDYLDSSIMTSHYGETVTPPGSEPWDINDDGVVDYLDSSILSSHYGESY